MSEQQPARPFGLKTRLTWLLWIPLLVGLDQGTKAYAVRELAYLEDQPPISMLGDLFRLTFAENEGAYGSLGSELTASQRVWVLIIPNIVLLSGLLIWMLRHKNVTRLQFAALGLIFAGGVGNLIDRVRLGYVVDFLNVGIGENFRTFIFNVADMYITGAVVLLGWIVLRPDTAAEVAPASNAAKSTP